MTRPPNLCPSASSRRGAALVAVVVALVLLQLLVVGMTLGGARDQDLSARRVEAARAFYAAETGMNLAVREFVRDLDEDGNGIVGGVASTGSPRALTNANVQVAVVDATVGLTKTGTITALGTSGLATRRVSSVMTRTIVPAGASGLYTEVWHFTGSSSSINSN